MSGRQLSGAWNFRDIAESTGLRAGRFFRSSELSGLDDSGRDAFRRLGITDVADLRSPQEVERRGPGAVPDGVVVSKLDEVPLSVDGGLAGSTGRGAVLVPPGAVLITGASAATFMST